MTAATADANEAARMACDCRGCGGSASRRPDGDCLRDDITEAILDTLAAALQGQPRTPEWLGTYNAALAGIYAAGDYPIDSQGDAHARASDAANQAHGELKS